jgi:hypothetical protein
MTEAPRHGMPGSTPDLPTPSEQQAATTSFGDLIAEVSRDISTLMRQEIELAKAELKQTAKQTGKGAGLFGGAGVAGFLALMFLSIAVWWALGYVMGNAWSAVIVAVVWGIVAAVLYFTGKKELDEVEGMPQTVDTVKQIPDALKRNEENR